MFELSSIVVYPAYGVAKITREVVKKIEDKEVYFFELNFISKDVKILIPRDNIDFVGIRPLCSPELLEGILKSFFCSYSKHWIDEISLMSWNRRSKEYQVKIRKGELGDIAKIYRDIRFIENHKVLSFGEKSILQQVEELLCEEISYVYEREYNEILYFIRLFTASSFNEFNNAYLAEDFLQSMRSDSFIVDFNTYLSKAQATSVN